MSKAIVLEHWSAVAISGEWQCRDYSILASVSLEMLRTAVVEWPPPAVTALSRAG